MSTIEARTFTSGADMVAAARAVNRRLWKAHVSVIITAPRVERIWTSYQQAHVAAYLTDKALREYEHETIEAGEPRHEDQETRVWISQIIVECAKHYGVSVLDIKSARRTRQVVKPRQVAMYLAKTMTLYSLPSIGRLFGGRDHTTCLHAVRKITELIESGDPVALDVEAISKALKGAA